MKVSNILKVSMILGAGLFAAACSDSKSDPGTESKSDLNPPGTLSTVTGDKSVELRWTAGNVEEDLNGYYVFYVDASKVTAANKPTYPAGVNVGLSGVPRCLDNTKFFQQFGFPATDKACEDDTAQEAAAPADKTTAGLTSSSNLADSTGTDTGTDTESEAKLTGFAKCDNASGTEPSLPAVPPVVTTQKCEISGLTNGTTYAFFVMAVRDDLTKVSWTSNVINDTPSSDALPADSKVTLGVGQMIGITVTPTDGTAKVDAAVTDCPATGGTDSASPCNLISIPNTLQGVTDAKIYLSRSATYGGGSQQRLYVSAPEGGLIKIQPRGPQTWDPMTKAKANRIPGDAAASTYPTTGGTKYVVYNNQVFDLEISTASSAIYYGKLVVNDVTYETATDTANATLNIALILQPLAGSTDYFTTAHFIGH